MCVLGLALEPAPFQVVLGLLGLVVVVARDIQENPAGLIVPARGNWWIAICACIVFVLGVWIDSDSAKTWGLALIGVIWIFSIHGDGRIGGFILLLGLACMPEGLLQDTLLIQMQRGAAGIASWALDLVGIPHVARGVVIETVHGALFVEEACSGMKSLLTGLVIAQIYFAWKRTGVIISVLGLAWASVLLFSGNCLRIVLIATIYSKWNVDWTSGWRHELSGLMVYLLVLCMLPGVRLVLLDAEQAFLKWRYPWVERMRTCAGETRQTAMPRSEFASRLIRSFPMPAMWATGVMVLASIVGWLSVDSSMPRILGGNPSGWPSLGDAELSEFVDGWVLDPKGREAAYLKSWALNHQVWLYRKGSRKAWISADLPFTTVHWLPNCYLASNWRVLRSQAIAPRDGDPLTVMELKARNEERSLLVMFANFDLSRQVFVRDSPTRLAERWENIKDRLTAGMSSGSRASGPFCQMQLVLDGRDAAESATGRDALDLFNVIRRDLAGRFVSNPKHEEVR